MRACSTFALLLLVTLVTGCPKGEAPKPADAAAGDARVCCESFGYGAMMAKCCESYAWTSPEACVTPTEMAGGGKAVVDDEKCADAPK